MAKTPMWNRTLSEVLGYETQKVDKKSERTGNVYQADVIPNIELVVMGAPVEVLRDNGQKTYRYSVFDMKKDLEYQVTCSVFLNISGVRQVIFKNLTGGALANGRGWYKADSVALAVKK
ncbi:hypothetical protein [Lactobacillus amylovorus]|uniref:hypothetical protein n=1 Tax=Lactobacillus amylovorus TaxID=1604 RepID=UPI0022E3EA29|nr:hypothetical protein [Lactobacillus amylovorus]